MGWLGNPLRFSYPPGGGPGGGGDGAGDGGPDGTSGSPDGKEYGKCGTKSCPIDVGTGRMYTLAERNLYLPGPLPRDLIRAHQGGRLTILPSRGALLGRPGQSRPGRHT